MTEPATVQAKVLRAFRDHGTDAQFTEGQVVNIDAGAFANYRAAALVEKAPEEAATNAKSKGKADT